MRDYLNSYKFYTTMILLNSKRSLNKASFFMGIAGQYRKLWWDSLFNSCWTHKEQNQSKHLARISWVKFNVLTHRNHRSSILHEYLDYENLWFLNLKILKSQARSRSSGAISDGFFRFEIKKIFSVWYS